MHETLSPSELKEKWSNSWIALVEDRREFAEVIKETLDVVAGLKDITIHHFTTCESFIEAENLDDYDVCFLDADFGYGNMKGPEAVAGIKARKPSMIIIGLTDQPEYLEAFEETDVDLALKKENLINSLDKILSLKTE